MFRFFKKKENVKEESGKKKEPLVEGMKEDLFSKTGKLAMEIEIEGIEKVYKKDPKIVDTLIAALRSDDARTKDWAALRLGELAPDSKEAFDSLTKLARDLNESMEVRNTAYHAAQKIWHKNFGFKD